MAHAYCRAQLDSAIVGFGGCPKAEDKQRNKSKPRPHRHAH